MEQIVYKSPRILEERILLAKIRILEPTLTKKEKKFLAERWNTILAFGDELFLRYDFDLQTLLCIKRDFDKFLYLYPKSQKIYALNLKETKRIKSALRDIIKRIEKLEKLEKRRTKWQN